MSRQIDPSNECQIYTPTMTSPFSDCTDELLYTELYRTTAAVASCQNS